jgi:hypothetical protein
MPHQAVNSFNYIWINNMIRIVKLAFIGLSFTATSAYAAAPVTFAAACCAIGACCGLGMDCCP